MTSESFGNDIETGVEKLTLPEQLKGISNEKDFINIYGKIKSWYGENFSDNEFSIIKEIRNRGCKEYGGQFNTTKLAILGNRIDTGIFEFKYTNFINIDKNIIRQMNDTNRQRKFREVAIKLIKKYNSLFDSDIKIIESEFKNAFNNKKTPNFDIISEKISQNKGNQNNNETISTNENINNNNLNTNSTQGNYNDLWPSDADVETMLNLKISPFFEKIKKEIFKIEQFDSNGNKKYLEGFFNQCADEVSELYGNIENYSDIKEELLPIFKQHLFAISQGIEKSSTELTKDIKEKIMDFKPEDSLAILSDNVFDKDDKTDYSKYTKSSELTQEDKDTIKFLVNKLGGKWTEEEVTNNYYKYKYLEEKKINGEELSEKEKEDFKGLKELFVQTKRLKRLEEIKNLELSRGREYSHKPIYSSIEYATGNMKDIKPIAIVENNEKIKKYVYGDEKIQKELDTNSIKLSNEDKKRLFKALKEQKKGDFTFLESIKYLNDDLTINKNLVNLSRINIQSVINNQKKIENMIKELAAQENLNKSNEDTIKEINIRRSTMICCFRAISNFFDTVNNNGENFASEFEIEDVNKNIEFDEKTGIISMEGTIGANKNHVKLYYDTNKGTLEFDDFLSYNKEDGSESYTIGKGNGKRKVIGTNLPNRIDMEKTAKNIDSHLISKLSLNIREYSHVQGFVMSQAIYLKHFVGVLGVNMETIKLDVQKFNEENILKQDIINNIYNKFYNQKDINQKLESCLTIDKGNHPKQFQLIKLISDTINNCGTSELLRFRNAMNELDDILINNHELVNKDILLKYLFADNLKDNNDIIDNSKTIMDKENNDLTTNSNNSNATYESEDKNTNNGDSAISYELFLNLFSEEKSDEKIINLAGLETAIETIKTSGKQLLDEKKGILRDNYLLCKKEGILPDFSEIENVENNFAQELQNLENDILLENQLQQAYT